MGFKSPRLQFLLIARPNPLPGFFFLKRAASSLCRNALLHTLAAQGAVVQRKGAFMRRAMVLVVLISLAKTAAAEPLNATDNLLDDQLSRAIYAADRVAQPADEGWHWKAEGMYIFSPVTGYFQTPSGGQ